MCRPRDVRALVQQSNARTQHAKAHPQQVEVPQQFPDSTLNVDDVFPPVWDVESWRKSADPSFWVSAPEELCPVGADHFDNCIKSEPASAQDFTPSSPSTASTQSIDETDRTSLFSVKKVHEFKRTGKWRRRDITKHLAGERNRRAKRMGKVQTLRAMLPGFESGKPTVNQILAKAIEVIQDAKAKRADSSPAEKDEIFRSALRASSKVASLALDSNMCVMDASDGIRRMLHWPGGEDGMRGVHLSAIMQPTDASVISGMVESNRHMHTGFGMQANAVFNTFSSVDSSCCGLAFPSGYLPRCPLTVSVYGSTTMILVEGFIPA